MADFYKAFEKIQKNEGGYVNNKNDKGGETFMGICRKYYPDNFMWQLIDEIKIKYGTATATVNRYAKNTAAIITQVRGIYRQSYWNKLNLDVIPSQRVAQLLFDDAVNRGISAAIKTAQKLVGLPETGRMSTELTKRLSVYGKRK